MVACPQCIVISQVYYMFCAVAGVLRHKDLVDNETMAC